MDPERDDLDIPAATTRPATEGTGGDPWPDPTPDPASGPPSLDPERDDVDRNAASGGWGGATEQIENDFEDEQLRRRHPGDA